MSQVEVKFKTEGRRLFSQHATNHRNEILEQFPTK